MSRDALFSTPAEKAFHQQQAALLSPEEIQALLDAAPSEQERCHRRQILEDILARQLRDGLRSCAPLPDRAKQFAPFDALTGYEELVQSVCEEDARFGFWTPDTMG